MLTPEEIQSREFLVSLRGYDRDEVHAFLDEVAAAFAQLRAEADDTTPAGDVAPVDDTPTTTIDRVDVEAAPSPFAAIGAETQQILEAAQAAGEEMRARAAAEANRARDELMSAAEAEMLGLREQVTAAHREIDVLRLQREEMSDHLRQARDIADLALMELGVDAPTADAATADAAMAESAIAEGSNTESRADSPEAEGIVPGSPVIDDLVDDPTAADDPVAANLFSTESDATSQDGSAEDTKG